MRYDIEMARDSRDSYIYSLVTDGLGRDILLYDHDSGIYNLALNAIRHIFRARSNCNKVPSVTGFIVLSEPNVWGHVYEIEINYSTRGYRAVYAASDALNDWQCYFDIIHMD